MAQKSAQKAKVSDRPALRDLTEFVVPHASAKWYNLGLQLFNQRDERLLHKMTMEVNKPLEEQCREVFRHWLETKKNASWNKLIISLKSHSVNLPNVARDIEKMFDNRSFWVRGIRRFLPQTLQPITDISSSSCESIANDADRSAVENDSEEETQQASSGSSRTLKKADSMLQLYYKPSVPMHMINSHSMSTISLPATLDSPKHIADHRKNSNKFNFRQRTHSYEQNEYAKNKSQENEQLHKEILVKERQEHIQEIEELKKVNEELTEQLNELMKQLQYKRMFESEREQRIRIEDQHRAADKKKFEKYMQDIDAIKQLLEKEQGSVKQIAKKEDLLALDSKQILKCSDTNEMHEKRINEMMTEFNRHLKDCQEAHRKDLQTLQATIEELKRRDEMHEKQIKQLKHSEEVQRKELDNLKADMEKFKRNQMIVPKDTWSFTTSPDVFLRSPDNYNQPPHHVAEVKLPVANRLSTSQANTQSSNHTSPETDVANGPITKNKLATSTKESHLTMHEVLQTCEKLSVTTTLLWPADNGSCEASMQTKHDQQIMDEKQHLKNK